MYLFTGLKLYLRADDLYLYLAVCYVNVSSSEISLYLRADDLYLYLAECCVNVSSSEISLYLKANDQNNIIIDVAKDKVICAGVYVINWVKWAH